MGDDCVTTDAGDRDHAVLERLPQGLERGARELRQLVQQEDAVVRECAGMSLESVRRGLR
jgi:hypothetical protein